MSITTYIRNVLLLLSPIIIMMILAAFMKANAAVSSVEYYKCYSLQHAGNTIIKIHLVNKSLNDSILAEIMFTDYSFFKGIHYLDIDPASDVLPDLTKVECPK